MQVLAAHGPLTRCSAWSILPSPQRHLPRLYTRSLPTLASAIQPQSVPVPAPVGTPLQGPPSRLPTILANHPAPAAQGTHQALIDTFGRRHKYLRISLTDRCNLRCKYCMPEEGEDTVTPNAQPELLSTDELLRVISLFVRLGVRKIRLTGGEPTIRNDLDRIMGHIGELSRGLPKPLSLGITTNGIRLRKFMPDFKAAGLRNINLSLDTLVSAKWPLLTRKPQEWHKRVMKIIEDLMDQEEHFTLKVNCVLLKGVNDDEIGEFAELTRNWPLEVRFLEFMPFDGNSWSKNRLVSQATIVDIMQKHLHKQGVAAERLPPDSLHDVANLWQVPGWRGRIGIIASMSDAFCGGCNRLRLTSSGEIRNCLFGEEGWSLRDLMREGASDDQLTTAVATGIKAKNFKLGGAGDMQELKARSALRLPMIALGG